MSGRVTTTLAQRQDRWRLMVDMRDKGMTLEEIGRALDPPIKKQRVEAIFRGGPPRPVGRPPRQ